VTSPLPRPDASTPSPRDVLVEQLLEMVPRLRRRFEQSWPPELRDELSTVTMHQVEALRHLRQSGGMTMAELAQSQHIGLSSATALADRLLRQGLAQRTSDPNDRRVVRVVPTDAARQLVERFCVARLHTATRTLGALDDDEVATLLALLTKIAGEPDSEADPHG
jgi:DNA-binding MarR family transcriptional regulator